VATVINPTIAAPLEPGEEQTAPYAQRKCSALTGPGPTERPRMQIIHAFELGDGGESPIIKLGQTRAPAKIHSAFPANVFAVVAPRSHQVRFRVNPNRSRRPALPRIVGFRTLMNASDQAKEKERNRPGTAPAADPACPA